ncbi:hypothetical protein A2U01_0103607, partial [Trifolium medium]|nr:hypothetical protein [Trifolium medium]
IARALRAYQEKQGVASGRCALRRSAWRGAQDWMASAV